MELAYYPGCTLKTRASDLEKSALASMAVLGVNLIELPRWNCCGTVYSLADDDLIHHVAAVRNLIRVKEQGKDRVVTLCAFCYNTLHRANLIMKDNADKRFAINTFMDDEIPYVGEVTPVHLLQVLRDNVGWGKVQAAVKKPLADIKVAGYYGCTLLRPASAAIDAPERPTVMQALLRALGGTAVDFPFQTECCGAYQVVSNPEIVKERSVLVLESAARTGAEAMVVTCPLCEYNLRQARPALSERNNDFHRMPVFYFTQLMALAFGLPPEMCGLDDTPPETKAWLKSKGLLP